MVVDPLQHRSTLGTALFENRIDQLVLAAVVNVKELDRVLEERTDHLDALRVGAGLGDALRCRVQRSEERPMDGIHVRYVSVEVPGAVMRCPLLVVTAFAGLDPPSPSVTVEYYSAQILDLKSRS